jgi:hypothetical protein
MKKIVRVMMCAVLLSLASAVVGTAAPPQVLGTPREVPSGKDVQPRMLPTPPPPPPAKPACKTGARVWDGDLGYEMLTEVENNIPPGAYFSRNVNCSVGKKAVGGGGAASTREVKIWQSSPSGIGWRVQGKNDYPGTISVTYYVICICAN